MRRTEIFFTVAAALCGSAVAASAQSLSARLAPQFQTYSLGDYDRTVSQLAVPMAAEMQLFSRMSLDVGTAYAQSQVKDGVTTSKISGLTDTQVRTNLTFGNDNVVFTGGITLPTGQSTIPIDQIVAAGQIGGEFLAFPIPTMGAGLAATGGVALARNFGAWNLGAGGAFRMAQEYEPYQSGDSLANARFQPGSEVRARLGVDRSIGQTGTLSFGFTFSRFTEDKASQAFSDSVARFAFNSGDRFISQVVYSTRAFGAEVFLSAWDVIIAQGIGISGETPGQNILNAAAAMGWNVGRMTLEPNIEARLWTVGGSTEFSTGSPVVVSGGREGIMGVLGLRSRIPAGVLTLYPGVAFSAGKIGRGTQESSLTGFRGTLTAHLSR